MPPWRFIGRSAELSLLAAAAAGETGRGLVVAGAAGVGKSRLLREALASLDPDQFAVWATVANVATGGLPFGSFAAALPADQPAGLTPAGLIRWAIDALKDQAAGRPIVIAIDDVHLVDPLSAAMISIIARSGPATILATVRSGELVHDSVSGLWKDDLVDRIDLAPLAPPETAELLRDVLGGPVDPRSVERLHALTQGNALYLRELVQAARTAGDFTEAYGIWRWTGRPELAATLVEIVDAQIGQLSDDVRTVVELVALGEPLGLHLLTVADPRAVEIAEERALILIDSADRRRSARLGHPLYGEVVRRRCPVTRTRRLLAQLAEMTEATGARRRDDLLRIAVWRLDSQTACDPAMLLAAGQQAFAAFDIPLAARLLDAARTSGGGFDAALQLATILVLADRPDEALAALDDVRRDLVTSNRVSRWHVVQGLVAHWQLSLEHAADDLAAVAVKLEDPEDRAWVTSFEALMRLHRGECDESLRLARSVLDRPAASAGSRAVARSAIAHLQALRGQTAQGARTVAAIEAEAAQWRSRSPHVQLALELARGAGLIISGHVAGVDEIAAAEFADLSNAGDFQLGSGHLCIVLGQAARLRGRIAEAVRQERRACALLGRIPLMAALAHAERAHAAALSGEPAEAQSAMAEADRLQQPTTAVHYPWLEQARLWVQASMGDLETAATMARALARRLRDDSFTGYEAIALHDMVRLGRAEHAVDRLTDLVGEADGLTPILAAHARAAAARDAAGLLAVAERFARLGLLLFAAEAAAAAFNRLRQTRSSRAADAAFVLSTLLDSCENPRTPALLVSVPTLSPRERQIARLAGAGATSRSIAEQLYLSTRTVDNHLRRVYAKLGVAGRSELEAALRALSDG
jgi:DNA-binding CsgD family transcriptional regulator